MTTHRPVAYVPSSIDFDAATNPELRCYAKWVVHLVARRRFTHHLEPDGWVPLTFEYQRRFVPDRKAATVMRDLVAGRVLEARQDCQFFPGQRKGIAYQYRLAPAHRQSRLVAAPIQTRTLLGKIWNYQHQSFQAVTDPVHIALRRWALDGVTVAEGAPEHPVLDAMRQGEPWFAVCAQGRVHTAMTTLAREMRPWVRLDGASDLVSVDISHSQPLLLAVTLSREGLDDETFLHDCLAARVYARFAAALGCSRNDAKQRLFKLLYAAPDRYNRDDAGVFASLYPNTWSAVIGLSACHPRGWLARLMQRVESDLMIQGAAKRFLHAYPAIAMWTVHDALVVASAHAEKAEDAIRQAWADQYGLEPTVTIAGW